MKHGTPLLIKFIFVSAILYLTLGFIYQVSAPNILLTSIVVTILGYLGDLYMMPRIGNWMATFADLITYFFVIWFIGTYLFDTDIGTYNFKQQTLPLFAASSVAATLLAIGEWFYHRYLLQNVLDEKAKQQNS